MADPSSFDYFRRGEPFRGLTGQSRSGGVNYFRRGEPIPELVSVAFVFTDTGAGTITLSGTALESLVYANATAGTLTLSGTESDARIGTDSRGITLTTSGSGSEGDTGAASGAGTIGLNGYVSEAAVFADSASGTITASGTATDTYTVAVVPGPAIQNVGGNKFIRPARFQPIPAPAPLRYTRLVDTAFGVIYLHGAAADGIIYTDAGHGAVGLDGRSAGEGWNLPLPDDTPDPRVSMLEDLLADIERQAADANDRAVLLEAELLAGREEIRLLTAEANTAYDRAAELDARVQTITSRLDAERTDLRRRLDGEHEVAEALMAYAQRGRRAATVPLLPPPPLPDLDEDFARLLEDVLIASEA